MRPSTTSYAPQKFILINAGNYDYAEVELSGSLQIVGPNNTGKTTLINTLQFLYIDDRRHRNFGSHTYEQTCGYYFPNQYSYVLFESLGARGIFVLGWRGQSKVAGGEPQRFHYEGPFDRADFLEEGGQVREPTAVNDRLGVKSYTLIKSDSEHREILVLPTKGEPKGAGLVALQHDNQYPQFRETLKNLLCLSTITQDQMRDRLLMLAGLSAGKHALDVRKLLGEDYERLLTLKQKLKSFKESQVQIEGLIEDYDRRERLRGEQMFVWSQMRTKRLAFVAAHVVELESLRTQGENATHQVTMAKNRIDQLRRDITSLAETKGTLDNQLEQLARQFEALKEFEPDLTKAALANTQAEIRRLEKQLEEAESATRAEVDAKIKLYRDLIAQKRATIAQFDRALITVLRSHLDENALASLAQLFNFQLLHQPVGENGIWLRNREEFVRLLFTLSQRIHSGMYRDPNVELPLPANNQSLAELADLEVVRTRLREDEKTLKHWEDVFESIMKREAIAHNLKQARSLETKLLNQIFNWELLQTMRAEAPRLRTELEQTKAAISAAAKDITKLEEDHQKHGRAIAAADEAMKVENKYFDDVIQRHGQCNFPDFSANIVTPEETPPDNFDPIVTLFLNRQKKLVELDGHMRDVFHTVEAALGSDFVGKDQEESIRSLREQLEALPGREETLLRDWDHQFHEIRATFSDVLRGLDDVKSAADKLKRSLSQVQVSNLKALSMDVVEQGDVVGSLRKLATIEQPGLFDDTIGIKATLDGFRQKFEDNPLLRYVDLFTLRFTVTGADGKLHHYQDFKQIESHGTSITIKVLFNLLVLRGLLRESQSKARLCQVPFFLDEIHSLDAANRRAVLVMARELGFIAITAAPESVSEVDALYFLQPKQGRIVLRHRHRLGVHSRVVTT